VSSQEGGQSAPQDADLALPPEEFAGCLEHYERILVELRDKLYEGSWDRILGDLKARLDGKPYVYKLSQTITRDIAAIGKLQAYEARHGVNLAEVLRQIGGAKP